MTDHTNPTRSVVKVKVLADHQRQAWNAIVAGRGILSRAENSFLHNVREQIVITDRQRRWLADIDVRLQWELSHEHS